MVNIGKQMPSCMHMRVMLHSGQRWQVHGRRVLNCLPLKGALVVVDTSSRKAPLASSDVACTIEILAPQCRLLSRHGMRVAHMYSD